MSVYSFRDREKAMQNLFALAKSRGPIMLIDNVDHLLPKLRVKDNNDQNNVIPTLLRASKSYKGVVFLSSNRVDNFDEAFETKLNLRLRYPALNANKREQIW